MLRIITFLSIFLSLFGFKIGIVDFSLIGSACAIVATALSGKTKLRLHTTTVWILALLLLVLGYSILVYSLSSDADALIYQRYIRATISTFCLSLLIYNTPLGTNSLISYVKISILIHAFFIILQVIRPDIQNLMAPLVGYTKTIFFLRAFGLANGFDTAGYFCIAGTILCFWSIFKSSSFWSNYFMLLIITCASFFTARNVMVISLLMVAIVTLKMLSNRSISVKSVGILNLILGD